MEHRLGTLRGLDSCASSRGTFTVLALDHRNNLRQILEPGAPDSVDYERMVDLKRSVARTLADASTGVLLDPEVGAAQAIVEATVPGMWGSSPPLSRAAIRGRRPRA